MRKFTLKLKSLLAIGLMALMPTCAFGDVTETYDFYNFATGNGYMTSTGDAISQTGTSSYVMDVYKVENLTIGSTTMDFNDRFAFFPVETSYKMYWRFRNDGTTYQKGLVSQWNGNGKTANNSFNISILGLYNGDKVTITYSIRSGKNANLKFTNSGIATLDGTAVEADGTLVSGSTYIIAGASDDDTKVNLDLYSIDNNVSIHKVVITSSKVSESVTAPTMSLVAANNGERTIKIDAGASTAGNPVTTYYTTDGTEPTTSSTSFTTSSEEIVIGTDLTVAQDFVVKAMSISDKNTSSDVASQTFSAGTTLSLTTPTWTKTSYADGVSKVVLNSKVDGYALNPEITICYTLSDGAEQSVANGGTIDVEDGVTLKYYAKATGYDNSSEGTVTAVAPFAGVTAWTEKYNGIVTENAGISLGTDVVLNASETPYYNLNYSGTKLSDRLLAAKTVSNHLLRPNGLYGGEGCNYVIANLKKGQYIVLNGVYGNGAFSVSGSNNLTPDEWATIPGQSYAFTVKEDGYVIFNVARYGYLQSITLKSLPIEVSVGPNGIATFTPSVALDFTNATSIKAYTATVSETTVTLTETKTVAAGEGVIIQSVNGGEATEAIAVANPATATEGNALVGTLVDIAALATTDGTYNNYILNFVDGKAGFYQANDKKVAAGKAYLQVPVTNGAKALTIVWNDGETTGIKDNYEFGIMNSDAATFDLSGRKVANPVKGLYIKNGKKFIVK